MYVQTRRGGILFQNHPGRALLVQDLQHSRSHWGVKRARGTAKSNRPRTQARALARCKARKGSDTCGELVESKAYVPVLKSSALDP